MHYFQSFSLPPTLNSPLLHFLPFPPSLFSPPPSALVTHRAAYYALCLVSKTPLGAENLLELHWSTVCHSITEKWPLTVHQSAGLQMHMHPMVNSVTSVDYGGSLLASPAATPRSVFSNPMGLLSSNNSPHKAGTPLSVQIPHWMQVGAVFGQACPTELTPCPVFSMVSTPHSY